MTNVTRFNEELAVKLGLPAAILLKKLVQNACNIAAQLEDEEGYEKGPTGVGRYMVDPSTVPYLRPDQIDDGLRQLIADAFVEEQFRGDPCTKWIHITEKALEAEDRDGELEWRVYYKSPPFCPPNTNSSCA